MTIFLLYTVSPVIMYIIMLVFGKSQLNENQKQKKQYLFWMAIIIILMIGLRSPSVGSTDTAYYCSNWEYISGLNFEQFRTASASIDLESGYLFCVWVFSHIFKNPQMLLVLSAIFFAISICRFVYYNCKDVVFPFLVFNCLGLFIFIIQGLRQGLAMCICLWAFEKIKKDQHFKFIILVLIAMLFHASAIVFFSIYILRYMKIKFSHIVFFSIVALVGINLLPKIFGFMNVVINDDYKIGSEAENGGVIAILIYLCIIVFALITRKKNEQKDDNIYDVFIYMAIIGVFSLLARNMISDIAERVGYYFAFSQMALVANSIAVQKEKGTKVALAFLVSALCLGVAVYKASYSVIIPYEFFWQT